MKKIRILMSLVLIAGTLAYASPALADAPAPGDLTITLSINDSAAGGSYNQDFERAYDGVTGDGTPVYIYVPAGGIGHPEVEG